MSKYNVFKDGDQFCATFPGFVNLQESYAGFGPTEPEAIQALLESSLECFVAASDRVNRALPGGMLEGALLHLYDVADQVRTVKERQP